MCSLSISHFDLMSKKRPSSALDATFTARQNQKPGFRCYFSWYQAKSNWETEGHWISRPSMYPRSHVHFYIATHYTNMDKTFWTYSIIRIRVLKMLTKNCTLFNSFVCSTVSNYLSFHARVIRVLDRISGSGQVNFRRILEFYPGYMALETIRPGSVHSYLLYKYRLPIYHTLI